MISGGGRPHCLVSALHSLKNFEVKNSKPLHLLFANWSSYYTLKEAKS